MKKNRTYSELILLPTLEERFNYLKIKNRIGASTFGHDRYLNQFFYKSKEWRNIRNKIIARDNGCDLALDGREINGEIYIHHMNPISAEDLIKSSDYLLNPEYLICVSDRTHKAIHYGDYNLLLDQELVVRRPNDTCPWKGVNSG